MFAMILYMKMILMSSNLLCSYIEFTLYTHILHHMYPNQFFEGIWLVLGFQLNRGGHCCVRLY